MLRKAPLEMELFSRVLVCRSEGPTKATQPLGWAVLPMRIHFSPKLGLTELAKSPVLQTMEKTTGMRGPFIVELRSGIWKEG